jgi:hypothetical protein
MSSSDHDARLVEFHAVWVAGKDEREAIETACLEEYFGYGLEYFLESNLRLFELMKDYLHTFVFDRRGAHVPEGENRWEYLTKNPPSPTTNRPPLGYVKHDVDVHAGSLMFITQYAFLGR